MEIVRNMKILRNKKYLFISIISIAFTVGALWFFAHGVFAQNIDPGLNVVAETGLSNQDPRIIIARIIRIILGFLGVVAVGLIIYAGFIWMTAKGEEEKINQAKKIMLGAVIGLVIVLGSFGLATFILNRLSSSTGGSSNGGGGGGGGFGGGADTFLISGTTPAKDSVNVPRNAIIRFRFNKNIRPNSVNDSTFSVSVNGQRNVNGSYVEFVPEANCEEPNQELKCFPKNTEVTVSAQNGSGGIISVDGKELACANGLCSIKFTVGETVDTKAPKVNIVTQQVCADANFTLRASSIDDYGVSRIDFFAANNQIGSSSNNSNPFVGSPFNAEMNWDTSALTIGENVGLKATAYDLDSNNASAEKSVKVVPAHCCNNIKDEDETGIDCGGSCLSCEAMARPIISNITPAGGFCSNNPNKFCRKSTEFADCGANANCDLGTPNGSNGNFITIIGSGFGKSRGKVFFNNNGTRVEAPLADDPSLGNPSCTNEVWKENQVIAIVPTSALDGSISITTGNDASDSSDDEFGPLLNDFKKNNIARPGICALSPAQGKINDVIQYEGLKLTAAEAYYGSLSSNIKASVSSFNNEKQGSATVPNLVSGLTTTFVLKDNIDSNYIPFTKESEPYDGPVISSIEPLSGPVGQYVTIRGSGFGGTRGTSKVFFGSETGKEADYQFPEICSDSIWSDKQIVVKVPENIASGNSYKITILRAGFNPADSGSQLFNVSTGSPDPGICKAEPSLGQTNSVVAFWGEYFRGKDASSTIRFYNNKDQKGTAITYWDIDQEAKGIKPWKAITTVPQTAATGPVKIIIGSPAQSSNALNFTVGQCTKDSDCGSGTSTCCSAGLPEAGKCKATPAECYGSVATSVYEWRFSTSNTTSCAPDQEQCGTVCCSIGDCENPAQNKCRKCLSGQNQCANGDCCNLACETPPGGGNSYCPDPTSCSGYSYNQCLEGFYCPNSPGLCSPYPGTGNPVVTGQCGNAACNDKPGCANGACSYDAQMNRCVKNNTNDCRRLEMRDSNNNVVKLNNQTVAGQCEIYNNNPRWHISNFISSCPVGWTRLANNKCVDASGINGDCSKCSSPFACQMKDNNGKCAINVAICPNGSNCDTSDNQCKKADQGRCDCCCDKNNQNRDCCAGLTCEGSCGSGQSNLGLCSGCAPGGVPNDDLCNCVGTNGKFCMVNQEFPSGACVDCSMITDPQECSNHSQCCIDGKNNNRCTSVTQGGSRFENNGLQYCAYYNCKNGYPNSCDINPVINGVYNKLNTCEQNCTTAPISCANQYGICDKDSKCPNDMRCDLLTCECKSNNPGAGQPCHDPLTNACTGNCTAGYQCLLPGYGGPANNTDCRCCCKPPKNGEPDTCKQINKNLDCIANQGLCTSPLNERGLCCGCTSDAMCGDVATTGCGLTDARCCQTRPSVASKVPSVNSTDVCRNTAIEATFNQRMDSTSFSNNVRLIGDYGQKPCPVGYSLVAEAERPNKFFAGLIFDVKKTIAKVFPSLLSRPAFADFSNYCYVPGTAIVSDISPTQSKVSYRISKPLEATIRYYMVMMGDPDLVDATQTDQKDYYNANIVSISKIGMIGFANGRVPTTFNTTDFKNAEIWSFTTGKDVCLLERVDVQPSFQLFQKPGQTGDLEASAMDKNNRLIQSIPDLYSWSWSWSSDNSEVARVDQKPEAYQATATSGNKQDSQTLARAKATVVADKINTPSTVGRNSEGVAQLRTFFCENPWPVYYAYPPFPPDYNWPWQDSSTGLEFYYCRDKSGVGTLDDLPALVDSPIIKQGARKICMFGANAGKVCSSDTNCNNLSGSCLPEVLKEFFFFRETEPGIPAITGNADNAGKKVTLHWQPVANAAKYKVYYGMNQGQYVFTTEVPGSSQEITKTIDGLVNGLNYYFAVTAISNKNQESIYSNELKIKPQDTMPPAVPNLRVSSGDGKVSLFWDSVPDAINYIAYLGVQPRNGGEYPISNLVTVTPPANTPNVIFSSINGAGLNNDTIYYVAVRSVDQYGNVSNYSTEISKKPNEPYITELVPASGEVTVNWLPFIAATGYTIYYGTSASPTGNETKVSSNTYTKKITNLNNGTLYYFRIKASKQNGQSAFSNERSIKPNSSDTE